MDTKKKAEPQMNADIRGSDLRDCEWTPIENQFEHWSDEETLLVDGHAH